MKNQVIKNLNLEMGKKILEYFQSLGVDTKHYMGSISEQDNVPNVYYGIIDGEFNNYCLSYVKETNTEIIELPTNPLKRGDKVLVWDSDESEAVERIFLAEIRGATHPFIITNSDKFLEGRKFTTDKYRYMKPILKTVELTLEDISNGKGVGVKPELIRIKK